MDRNSNSAETSLAKGSINQGFHLSGTKLSKPLHLQQLEKALKLDTFVRQVETIVGDKSFSENIEDLQVSALTKQQLRAAKTRVYNFSKIKKSRKWLKNILLDKSDSSESDLEEDKEYLRDMIRFHNLQKKVKRELDSGLEISQYQNYSASLLATSGQSLLSSEVRGKKPLKSTKTVTRKKPPSATAPAPVFQPATSTAVATEKILQPNATTSKSTPDNSINANSESLLIDTSKRIKLEKMLDEIPYDATLPDEILQSESSANVSEPGPSCTPSINDDIVYSSQLPDEIFDTEESSASMLSQCLSQPATFVSAPTITQPKCATAPPTPTGSCPDSPSQLILPLKSKRGPKKRSQNTNQEAALAMKRKRLWIAIARKEIPRAQKQILAAKKETLTNCKRMATWCQRERRRGALLYQKQHCRDQYSRARRLTKEMLVYWKHFERVEKDYRKRAEKEAQEQLKIDIELMEAKRQQRKLNFLITQTELYAHFMSKKMSTDRSQSAVSSEEILKQLEDDPLQYSGSLEIVDDYHADVMKEKALSNVKKAIKTNQENTTSYDSDLKTNSLVLARTTDIPQPNMFEGLLKSYQLKGMNWLYNLYENGINGILADEMGLGKTVQAIAFLATVAERHNIWGPFLVVAPASTLHNWQQEFSRFTPKFKLLPYWGNPNDRKVLRKFWNQKYLHREEASFHVLITSYQLIVQDVKYFQRIKWRYMVLDEAQAIKSTSSARWKILLAFQCRNRLLLSGTPIQNTMAELWALLHFIMPTLFDSHEEFNEWFSKDIESHAENKTAIDEKHLSRLHIILMPFMLRRIKKDVENELSDKIEIQTHCPLTQRQKMLYQALKNKISIEDLMQSSNSSTPSGQSVTSSLMNLVMQFRKVCNHPDLFERRDVKSPFYTSLEPFLFPRLLFSEGLCSNSFQYNAVRHKILYCLLSIYASDNVHSSLFNESNASTSSAFSFVRLTNLAASQLQSFSNLDLLKWWQFCTEFNVKMSRKLDKIRWREDEESTSEILLIPNKTTRLRHSFGDGCTYNPWTWLMLSWTPGTFGLSDHHIYSKAYSQSRETSLPQASCKAGQGRLVRVLAQQLTRLPKFLCLPYCWSANGLKAAALPREIYSFDQNTSRWQELLRLGGDVCLTRLLNHGSVTCVQMYPHAFTQSRNLLFFPPRINGLLGLYASSGWSPISIPDKESLVNDSGKMKVLDYILTKLKQNNHRALIYSQMTKMIDLLEEYMLHRKHTYMRLDGSSRISDRRDMVADFQTRSDIFVFLLSTRAGGLGINLTAADTVIFYDSDWNPTVDQQAMDRAHRLGQTKQVTVYRLICKGTIEERILQRATEKSEIQRMVISGGNFKPDTLKATEVVSLLLDDDELERKFRQKQEERRQLKDKEEDPPGAARGKRKGKPPKGDSLPKRKYVKRKKAEDSDIDSPSSYTNSKASYTQDNDLNFDSCPTSPYSEQSISSLIIAQDEDSNEPALIVDDRRSPSLSHSSTGQSPDVLRLTPDGLPAQPTPRRGTGRSRGRPRGSRARGPIAPRGRGTAATAALAAAELAGAQAGKSAALAAYASLSGGPTTVIRRGRGRGRAKMITFTVNHGHAQANQPGSSSGPLTAFPPNASATDNSESN